MNTNRRLAVACLLTGAFAACAPSDDGRPQADGGTFTDAASGFDATFPPVDAGGEGGADPNDVRDAAATDGASLGDVGVPDAGVSDSCIADSVVELCNRAGAECGSISTRDRCGNSRDATCGACPAGQACGIGAEPNRCGACPVTDSGALCRAAGRSCGAALLTDACGATRSVDCGECPSNLACSPLGRCVCLAETDAELCARERFDCGAAQVVDRCGESRAVSCGTCTSGLCGASGIPNRCALTCAPRIPLPHYETLRNAAVPAILRSGVCSGSAMAAFFNACWIGVGSSSSCDSWRSQNPACSVCLLTPFLGSTYGPFVTRPEYVDPVDSPAGIRIESVFRGRMACLERVRTGCGVAEGDLESCLNAACDSNPACRSAAGAQLASCRAAAAAGSCLGLRNAVFGAGTGACDGVVSPAGTGGMLAGDGCVPTSTEHIIASDADLRGYAMRLATSFCGP